MTEVSDQRRFHRVGHDAAATLRDGAREWLCQVEDICMRGALVRMHRSEELDPAITYLLGIQLGIDVHIEMQVRLRHRQGVHAGFQCVAIDADSVTRLRRLVELNLGDSALLERDLRALLRRA